MDAACVRWQPLSSGVPVLIYSSHGDQLRWSRTPPPPLGRDFGDCHLLELSCPIFLCTFLPESRQKLNDSVETDLANHQLRQDVRAFLTPLLQLPYFVHPPLTSRSSKKGVLGRAPQCPPTVDLTPGRSNS